MLDEGDNWGIDPLEFISRVNSSFENHMKVDGRTKKVFFHSWMNRSWNKRRLDNNISSHKEWKESDYRNTLNTTTDSFFKTHDKRNIKEGNELRQMKRKGDSKNDEQPIKRVCKAEKFKAIKYSLGPNEGYIAVRRCEYNTWERNEKRPRCKEIDVVGEVSIIWNPKCDCSHAGIQDAFTTHILAHKLNLENIPSKISGEFLILILLIPVINVLSIQ
ncbi:hypothetical protein Tco_1137932 [Tanacetum coccineum]